MTTERPPMWLRGRQASQRCAAGSAPRRAEVAFADAATALCGEHYAFGLPRAGAGGDDEGVTVVYRDGSAPSLGTTPGDDPGGPENPEEPLSRRPPEALVKGGHGVAGVPSGPQGLDELWPARQVDRDELGHLR